MAMGAAVKLRRVVQNVRYVLAVELLCAMQGIDYRRPLRSSAAIEGAHAALRAVVATLGRDRVLAPDIEAAAQLIASGGLDAFVPADLHDGAGAPRREAQRP
jgi:histidine ammonia-lyase